MALTALHEIISGHSTFRHLEDGVKSGQISQRVAALDAARPFLISALWHRLNVPLLVIEPRPEDARKLQDYLLSYLGDDAPVYLVPEPEVLPFERLVADAATNNQRMLTLHALGEWRPATPRGDDGTSRSPLVVASVSSALKRTISPEGLAAATHNIQRGQKVRLGELFTRWVDLGYQREEGVEIPGTFSHRGGIVDVYPPSFSLPVRIELWGDEVESLRFFDPASQRSVRPIDTVRIVPARETLPALADRDRVSRLIGRLNFTRCTPEARERFSQELDSLFSGQLSEELPLYNGLLNDGYLPDHLPAEGLLVLDREGEVENEALALGNRAGEMRATREARGEIPANFPSPQHEWADLGRAIEGRQRVALRGWNDPDGGFDFQPATPYYGRLGQLGRDLRKWTDAGMQVVVVSRHTRRLSEVVAEEGLGASVLTNLDSPPASGSISLLSGSLGEGWTLPSDVGGVVLLTDSELFGVAKQRRRSHKTPVRREAFLSELVPGGYVVHIDHGIARFAGTEQMESGEDQKEYLVLEYAESDRLYVPTDHLDRVAPYKAPSEQPPRLTRLGSLEWGRVKQRAKAAAKEMARELLEMYASRQVIEGHAFAPDSPWQQELEDAFPYEETADQERTILEVKQEMEGTRPMDRLVCGDVGYGKTEVALRAAFKTAGDSMQVAILVPTTVLAQQHYATFSERLSPFPVRVDVLSRFRTKKEQAQVVEGLRLGTVDIVIGTHRLLQKDVRFKNLGLVVVDEEQRFGVAHKERLKRMRREVDMMSLSATPIPRSLYMGLSGIRDMSTMETPPEERMPVKTYVSEYSDDVVKEALHRELERGGQVFFLHNRVQTIRRAAANLAKLVPQARIAIGHGRMAEADLEEVMVEFANGDVDVLVCTTIIESGLDIPNANTLIIDRADRFGLSQLYQLRGRVGRGGFRAYAYLLTPSGRRITEAASKRLKAILEAAELGAGFRIAMRDLEIRGAGNVLGSEQSGHIHAVGFDLYTQLLNEVVGEIKAGRDVEVPAEAEPRGQARVSLDLSAYIPESYISHLPTRLAIYQRLTRVKDRHEVGDTREEIRDRFGPLPQIVDNLLYLVEMKLMAGEASVDSVVQKGATVTLTLQDEVGGARLALEKALGPLVRVGNTQVHVSVRQAGDDWKEGLVTVLERLSAFREQIHTAVAG